MIRAVRISGEGFDADFVETTEYEEPHYPICESCEEETWSDDGWCPSCLQYADGRLLEVEDLGPGRIAA